MSIPTPASTPGPDPDPRAAVPPGPAGLWIAPAVWKTRTIRSRLIATASRRVSHTVSDGTERRPYAPQARSLYSPNTTSRVGSRTPVAKPMGGKEPRNVATLRRAFTFAGIRVHVRRIRRSTSPECAGDSKIRRFLELGVSKTAIAKLTGVSRTTLYSFMSTRGLRPSR